MLCCSDKVELIDGCCSWSARSISLSRHLGAEVQVVAKWGGPVRSCIAPVGAQPTPVGLVDSHLSRGCCRWLF